MLKKVIKSIIGQSNISRIKRTFAGKEPQYKIDFYKQFFKKGDIVFDVGANMGNRIKPFLEIGAKVIAVEPQESCWPVLKTFPITLIKKGLGAEEGVKDFYICETDVLSSFSKDFVDTLGSTRFKGEKWDKYVAVPMTTLDKLIEEFGSPQFIKVDVEGYELEVFKGLNSKIPYLSFEYTVPEFTENLIECIEKLSSISPSTLFNYSIGESFQISGQWLSKSEMIALVKTRDFAVTDFGDIYVSMR